MRLIIIIISLNLQACVLAFPIIGALAAAGTITAVTCAAGAPCGIVSEEDKKRLKSLEKNAESEYEMRLK